MKPSAIGVTCVSGFAWIAACSGTSAPGVASDDAGVATSEAPGAIDGGASGDDASPPTSASDASGPTAMDATGPVATAPRLALVYRGAASCSASGGGCSEAWAAMFASCQPGFRVAYVGPSEPLQLSEAVLATAAVYVQPGGNEDLQGKKGDWALIQKELDPKWIRDFVARGGRYLGSCTGGYLAGTNPWAGTNVGFDMIQSTTAEFITSPGATPTTPNDTLVSVVWSDVWGSTPTPMYFQDGPYFQVAAGASNVHALATYQSNGAVAALVATYGEGKVGVEGPHAEAPADWYSANDVPGGPNLAPGCDLIAKTLAP